MSELRACPIPGVTNECIKVMKVYDWVTLNVDQVMGVPIPPTDLIAIQAAIAAEEQLDLVVTMGPIADIDINVLSVTTKTVEVNGVEMEIGCAQILKTVPLTIGVYNLGTLVAPNPIPLLLVTIHTTLQFLESAGLCFPEGFTTDNITTHVRSAEVISLTALPVNGEFLLQVLICQDVQVEAEVKLEVLGRFCAPRDNTIDCNADLICDPVVFPEPCPNIYPVN